MRTLRSISTALLLLGSLASAAAATITFDDLISGQTSYGFDGDGDGIIDVTFSTDDPLGFNTVGPGLNQLYIREPGLEGSTLSEVDLRVDFLSGATNSIELGFALNSLSPGPDIFASLKLYDGAGNLLGSGTVGGAFTATPAGTSSFPEGQLQISFAGVAAYGLFDFSSEGGRYIIDDFSGDFGSVVPEPASLGLFLLGLAAIALRGRRPGGDWGS